MTRRVGLIGKPLKRRHSQVMHDAAFDAAGIDARYVLLELEPDAVEDAVRQARGPDWLGLGVTAPYKRLVAGLCDEVEADAETIGAVNNVARTADPAGSSASTPTRPGSRPASSSRWAGRWPGPTVVVAGAGGAAHAVVFACLRAGARRVTVGNRTRERPRPRSWSGSPPSGPGARAAVALDDPAFETALRSADLAVNATTVGMLDPGLTIPVDVLPASGDGLRSRLRARRDAAAPGRPGARPAGGERVGDADRRRRRSRSSAGPASPAWPTSCATAVAPLLADATARA